MKDYTGINLFSVMKFSNAGLFRAVFCFSFIMIFALQCKTVKPTNKMDTISSKPNVVVAHRGAWKHTGAPQNSMASLKAAIDLGCAGSEFDIHMTADSVLVIYHDADYFGIPIQKEDYSMLASKKLANGESIPLLEDFLKTGKQQTQTKLVLEIKPSVKGKEWALATTRKVVQMVQKMQAQRWSVYISFDYEILLEILRLDLNAHLQYLKGDKSPETLKEDGITGLDYHFSVYDAKVDYIETAQRLGLQLNAWTVNTKERMDSLLNKKFDFITTDEPEILLQMRRNN
jgi:glycerophosphoryl diester phosphodiesterase